MALINDPLRDNERQDDIRNRMIEKMKRLRMTQEKVEQEIGINKYVMWTFKRGDRASRLTLIKIEDWLNKDGAIK